MVKKTNKKKFEAKVQSNIITFDRIKKTRVGWAVFVGRNVIFISDALLKAIDKEKAS